MQGEYVDESEKDAEALKVLSSFFLCRWIFHSFFVSKYALAKEVLFSPFRSFS